MREKTFIRLDRFLSNAGIASRKDIKRVLKTNDITVNNTRVTSSGMRINPERDTVMINGQLIEKKGFVYYVLHKPMDIISTTSDPRGRTNVTDLIDTNERIYPIGRLDKDTHGLLILTNDGELTHKLIHPKYHVEKVYILTVSDIPTEQQLNALRNGVLLNDGITLPAKVTVLSELDEQIKLEMIIHEGRYRQIRRMCATVGLDLLDLERIQFGPIHLGTLPEGEYRELTENEIIQLRKVTVLQ